MLIEWMQGDQGNSIGQKTGGRDESASWRMKGFILHKLGSALGGRWGVLWRASTGHEAGPRVLGLLDGRHAEEPLELPTELRRALVPDRPRGGARVVAVVGHEPLCVVEPDSLQVLERRGGSHELEVVIKGRDAHARSLSHVFSTERLRVIGMDLLQNSNDAGEVVVPAGQGTEGPSLFTAEHAVDDLANRLAAEHAAVAF